MNIIEWRGSYGVNPYPRERYETVFRSDDYEHGGAEARAREWFAEYAADDSLVDVRLERREVGPWETIAAVSTSPDGPVYR